MVNSLYLVNSLHNLRFNWTHRINRSSQSYQGAYEEQYPLNEPRRSNWSVCISHRRTWLVLH